MVQGAGFQPGDRVEIHWDELAGPLLATATGPTFQVGATIPAAAAAPGTHTVLATGLDQNGQGIGYAAATFTVVAAPAPSTGAAAGVGAPSPSYPAPVDTSFAGCSPLPANVIVGPAVAGTITGTTDADRIFAGPGDDVVRARAGDDCVDLAAMTG